VKLPYNATVTFQEAVPTQTPAGQVIAASYENVSGLIDLPARVIAVLEEREGERMIVTEDRFTIIVKGDHAIRSEMVALTEQGVFDVERVARPTLGRPATLATIVIAERVAI
jgi:hypothetical protein